MGTEPDATSLDVLCGCRLGHLVNSIMEVIEMTRMIKILLVTGVSSVYLMQAACTFADHGFSMIPNGLIPNPFAGLLASLGLAT